MHYLKNIMTSMIEKEYKECVVTNICYKFPGNRLYGQFCIPRPGLYYTLRANNKQCIAD